MDENNTSKSRDKLIAELQSRLEEAEETLRAIQNGEVDAIVTQNTEGSKVYTLEGADYIYRLLVQNMSEGVVTLTTDGSIFYSNLKLASLIQFPMEKIIGRKINDFIHPDDLEAFLNIFHQGLERAKIELNFKSAAGITIPVSFSINFLRDLEGAYIVITDLREQKYYEELQTANKELQSTTEELQTSNEELQNTSKELQTANKELISTQDELRETIDKLEISNRELEQFAYVASHDLQEPLRMVISFAQLLERRYKDRLDGDADEFIGFIVDGANRMKDLIDDLLAFSRLNTEARPFELVDMKKSLKEVLSYLKKPIEENNTEITHEPLPIIRGDPNQIGQLFQNLISNAVKFHDDEPPRIHVSAEQLRDEWKIGIKDNGIGIDPGHQEKIFEIFKRLHTREEYEGTGIGLTICKRIVKRHGGRIWIESEPGEGSTFYFTLPK